MCLVWKPACFEWCVTQSCSRICRKIYTYLMIFILQIISHLDGESKFQMLALFSGRLRGAQTWRFYTGPSEDLRNISTKIYSLRSRTDLNLGELSSFCISYRITIYRLPLNGFRFIYVWQWKRYLSSHSSHGIQRVVSSMQDKSYLAHSVSHSHCRIWFSRSFLNKI